MEQFSLTVNVYVCEKKPAIQYRLNIAVIISAETNTAFWYSNTRFLNERIFEYSLAYSS